MMKKKRSHATVCVVLGGKTVVEVIYIYARVTYLIFVLSLRIFVI